jgi:hypothetical protein
MKYTQSTVATGEGSVVAARWEGWMKKRSRGFFPRWQKRFVRITQNYIAILHSPSTATSARQYIVKSATPVDNGSDIVVVSMVFCTKNCRSLRRGLISHFRRVMTMFASDVELPRNGKHGSSLPSPPPKQSTHSRQWTSPEPHQQRPR